MVSRALRGRWPLSPERRSLLMEELQLIALTATNPKTQLNAIELIRKMDELNLRDEIAQAQQMALQGSIIELKPEQVEQIGNQVEQMFLPPTEAEEPETESVVVDPPEV